MTLCSFHRQSKEKNNGNKCSPLTFFTLYSGDLRKHLRLWCQNHVSVPQTSQGWSLVPINCALFKILGSCEGLWVSWFFSCNQRYKPQPILPCYWTPCNQMLSPSDVVHFVFLLYWYKEHWVHTLHGEREHQFVCRCGYLLADVKWF